MRKQPARKKTHQRQRWSISSLGTALARGGRGLLSGSPKSPMVKIARAAGVVVAGCALLCGCYLVGVKASKPYIISYRESKDIATIKRQIAQAQAENQSLKSQIGYLKTDRGKVAEARKLGFVKSGEISIVVGRPEDDPDAADRRPAHQSVWSNVRKHATSALHQVKSLL